VLSSAYRGTWGWRAKLAWALLGPSVVLLIQVEGLLIIADVLGALDLRADADRRTAAVAVAALLLVTAAQLATGLWRRTRDARKELLGRRLDAETKLLSELRSNKPIEPSSSEPPREGSSDNQSQSQGQEENLWNFRLDRRIRRYQSYKDSQFRNIIARFGLEPTWAYQILDELGVPAAQAMSQQTQLLDARASGDTTALAVSLASFVGVVVVAGGSTSHARVIGIVIGAVTGLLVVARFLANWRSGNDALKHEEQYYPQLERLLELYRFELYKALAIEAPRDASEEKDGSLGEWRLGRGDVQYTLPEVSADSEVSEQVQGLADLLRGPELVGYEGYVSWEIRKDQVQLVFAKTPVSGTVGNTSLQVEGSGKGSHAPFDIIANSEDVVLTQVRRAVQAPVDGRATRVSFDLTPRPDARKRRGAPVIWFEIRQRGRFIQLMRVLVGPDPATQATAVTAPVAMDPAAPSASPGSE
jgi:hypothetical protein